MNLFVIAFQSVRANGVRTALTIAALAVAVLGSVTVSAASSTIEQTVTQRAILQGGPVTTILLSGEKGALGKSQIESIAPQLKVWSPTLRSAAVAKLDSAAIASGYATLPVTILFSEESLIEIRPFDVLEGRWLSDVQSPYTVGLVLNLEASNSLGARVGDNVRLRIPGVSSDRPAVVVGIVNDGQADGRAYASLLDGDAFLAANAETVTSSLLISGSTLTSDALGIRLNQLNSLSGTLVEWGIARTDTVEDLRAEVRATSRTFLVVGLLGLVVGALAVANVGLSALRERSSELSLRLALGARRWQLPVLVLIESQIVAIAAGILAVSAAFMLYPAVAAQFGAPYGIQAPSFPWGEAGLGVIVGSITAMIGAVAPAIHSLRVPVSRVLRA